MQKLTNLNRRYEQFRWFFTSDGVLVVGGKSDEQNEVVVRDFLRPEYFVMHTSEPGSPFMIVQTKNPSKKDLDESAVVCACFSKQWKLGEKEISVDIFKGEQIYKVKSMKTGTLGVKDERKTVKVKPELAVVIQKGKLRAVPKTTKEEVLAKIKPGNLSKEEAVEKISKKIRDKYQLPVSKEEIMSAIPSGNLSVK